MTNKFSVVFFCVIICLVGQNVCNAQKLKLTLKGHKKPVLAAAFSPNGKSLVTLGKDKFLKFWDVKNGKKTKEIKTGRKTGEFFALLFSPNGKMLATSTIGETLFFRDLQTGKEVKAINPPRRMLFGRAGFFTKDGTWFVAPALVTGGMLFTGRGGGTLPGGVWDTSTGKLLFEIKGTVVFLSHDGKSIGIGHDLLNRNVGLGVIDLATGKRTGVVVPIRDFKGRLAGYSIPPDFSLPVYQVNVDLTLGRDKIFKTSSRIGEKTEIEIVEKGRIKKTTLKQKKSEQQLALAFSPDGSLLVSVSGESNKKAFVNIWEVRTGKMKYSFPLTANSDTIPFGAFSPTGNLLAVIEGNNVEVWDISNPK